MQVRGLCTSGRPRMVAVPPIDASQGLAAAPPRLLRPFPLCHAPFHRTDRSSRPGDVARQKIHRATLTGADLRDKGSCGIDQALLDACDIIPGEQIEIYNVTNGARLSAYAIAEAAGSGRIIEWLGGAPRRHWRPAHHHLHLRPAGRRHGAYLPPAHRPAGCAQRHCLHEDLNTAAAATSRRRRQRQRQFPPGQRFPA
ncbi:putative Aspartate 1-decarboxylase [Thiomonas sp. X19]|nr:putative Aspartate 1-decarboxylase [Thiomonas sp. X19]